MIELGGCGRREPKACFESQRMFCNRLLPVLDLDGRLEPYRNRLKPGLQYVV